MAICLFLNLSYIVVSGGQRGPETFWAEIWGFGDQTLQKTDCDLSHVKFHCSPLLLSIWDTKSIKSCVGFFFPHKEVPKYVLLETEGKLSDSWDVRRRMLDCLVEDLWKVTVARGRVSLSVVRNFLNEKHDGWDQWGPLLPWGTVIAPLSVPLTVMTQCYVF